jgi:general secretion pathway protein B
VSYILDALRKSEQERQRGRLPDIASIPEQPVQTSGRARWWLAMGAFTLLNTAGVAGWWFATRQATTDSVPAPRAAESVPAPQAVPPVKTSDGQPVAASAPTPPAVVSSPVTAPTVSLPSPTPSVMPTPATQATPSSAPLADHAGTLIPAQPYQQVIVIPQGTSAVVQTGQSMPVTYPAAVVPAPVAATAEPVMPPPPAPPLPPELAHPIEPGGHSEPDVTYLPKLEELPPSVRARVPSMTFSSHLYSSMEQFRSVVINGQRVRQGSTLQPGLVLSSITENGVVLTIDGTSFQVDILGNWSR